MRDHPWKVVITDYSFPSIEIERGVLEPLGATVDGFQCKTESEVEAAVAGAHVVLTQFATVGAAAIRAMRPGGAIVRYGVGVDNVDLDAAASAGIAVANVPDYCVDEVADHTVALLLGLLRRVHALHASVLRGEWDAIGVAKPLKPFRDSSVGLVGIGRIGRAVVHRLRPFGFTFLAFDPFLGAAGADELGVTLLSLEELLPRADALTLHVPLTPDTHHLIDARGLRAMKPDAVLVNTARGGLVDNAALEAALRQGRPAAAALDVFEQEPLPESSGLRSLPNLVMTPHAAWYSDAALTKLQELAAEEGARALRGEALRCRVV